MENGQIMRFAEAPDGDGNWGLVAEVFTEKGPVLGRLMAPQNATAGHVRFVPDPALQSLAGAPYEGEGGRDFDGEEPVGTGTLTTGALPKKDQPRPPSPDDPRGLKRGRGR